ncbi:cell division/cell wall cluster transcriptional repressor MraZ [Candidatus Uhrbacteria bacterium RIFCSPLOWO2_02_FULL_49_11]|uniref:Transcriptional regulator MraZ n=1 Tax=Candidatus Uhrbacteria bacterium RIFCSPLOWO2_02_FULL_49_11 TaxID=1802409 RepID=A0A1F7VD62_9BACT|nr:MAG: cell division/cell wall cluster transcriptional repressor MraZ [Candidatus Uhrbacteria bacterium RIFCSPLOWO2_02_FULL_49_11]
MFVGEYKHSVDNKKRLAVPAKFRADLGKTAVITRGLDQCLFVFSVEEWEKLAQKLGSLPFSQADARSFVRLMLSGAMEVEFDQLGRILLPDYLKTYAGIGKTVVITGVFNRLEVWDEGHWGDYKDKAEKNVGDLAEKLGGLGI